LIELATAHQPPFQVPERRTTNNEIWQQIYSRCLLHREDYDNATGAEIEERAREQWGRFVSQDLPLLVEPIQAAAGSFESSLADGVAIDVPS
jgi:hypothetical protein